MPRYMTWKQLKERVEAAGMEDDDEVFDITFIRPTRLKRVQMRVVVCQLPAARLKSVEVVLVNGKVERL